MTVWQAFAAVVERTGLILSVVLKAAPLEGDLPAEQLVGPAVRATAGAVGVGLSARGATARPGHRGSQRPYDNSTDETGCLIS